MFYDFSFVIPTNTPISSPRREDIYLCVGVIHRLEIGFPAGCAGLAHIQIHDGLHQVWPTNPGGSFNSDGYTICVNEYYELFEPPNILTLVGWNDDDTYDHTIELRFGILPAEILLPEPGLAAAIKRLTKRLRL